MGGGGLRLKDRQTENIIRINEKYKNKNFKYKQGFLISGTFLSQTLLLERQQMIEL